MTEDLELGRLKITGNDFQPGCDGEIVHSASGIDERIVHLTIMTQAGRRFN